MRVNVVQESEELVGKLVRDLLLFSRCELLLLEARG
jgi:hypothetical protein